MKFLSQGEIFTQQMYDELKSINYTTHKLSQEDEGTVFIMERNIPKRQFDKLFKKIKRTNNIDEAKYVIASLHDLYIVEDDGGYIKNQINLNNRNSWYINRYIKTYNEINNKILILPQTLSFNENRPGLTPESYENIKKLLSSEDGDTFKLGFKLLFNHDYEKEKDLFVLCILSAKYWYRREKTILANQVIKKIKNDYPNAKF